MRMGISDFDLPSRWRRLSIQKDNSIIKKKRLAILHHIIRERQRCKRIQQSMINFLIARKRILFNICLLSVFLITNIRACLSPVPRPTSCRRHKRNGGWWDNVRRTYSEARFKAVFRVSRATFIHILNKIRTDIQKDSLVEDAVSPECRLGIRLYRLGRETTYLQFLSSLDMAFLPFVE